MVLQYGPTTNYRQMAGAAAPAAPTSQYPQPDPNQLYQQAMAGLPSWMMPGSPGAPGAPAPATPAAGQRSAGNPTYNTQTGQYSGTSWGSPAATPPAPSGFAPPSSSPSLYGSSSGSQPAASSPAPSGFVQYGNQVAGSSQQYGRPSLGFPVDRPPLPGSSSSSSSSSMATPTVQRMYQSTQQPAAPAPSSAPSTTVPKIRNTAGASSVPPQTPSSTDPATAGQASNLTPTAWPGAPGTGAPAPAQPAPFQNWSAPAPTSGGSYTSYDLPGGEGLAQGMAYGGVGAPAAGTAPGYMAPVSNVGNGVTFGSPQTADYAAQVMGNAANGTAGLNPMSSQAAPAAPANPLAALYGMSVDSGVAPPPNQGGTPNAMGPGISYLPPMGNPLGTTAGGPGGVISTGSGPGYAPGVGTITGTDAGGMSVGSTLPSLPGWVGSGQNPMGGSGYFTNTGNNGYGSDMSAFPLSAYLPDVSGALNFAQGTSDYGIMPMSPAQQQSIAAQEASYLGALGNVQAAQAGAQGQVGAAQAGAQGQIGAAQQTGQATVAAAQQNAAANELASMLGLQGQLGSAQLGLQGTQTTAADQLQAALAAAQAQQNVASTNAAAQEAIANTQNAPALAKLQMQQGLLNSLFGSGGVGSQLLAGTGLTGGGSGGTGGSGNALAQLMGAVPPNPAAPQLDPIQQQQMDARTASLIERNMASQKQQLQDNYGQAGELAAGSGYNADLSAIDSAGLGQLVAGQQQNSLNALNFNSQNTLPYVQQQQNAWQAANNLALQQQALQLQARNPLWNLITSIAS